MMTHDEFIRMARDAGFQEGWTNLWAENFERFAALVAAAEREACAKVCDDITPAEAERLALLSEELGECTQAIGKILRHGYESRDTNGGPTNREALEKEVADVLLAIRLLLAAGDMDQIRVTTHECMKAEAVRKYLHHQPPKGE